MKKIDESNQISEAVDTIVGEVISDEKPNDGKQQTGLKKRDTYAFGTFIFYYYIEEAEVLSIYNGDSFRDNGGSFI